MQEFHYVKPKTITEAVELLHKYGSKAKILAGGTDLIIALKDRIIECDYVIDIKGIEELNKLEYDKNQGLSIGSAICLNDIIGSEVVNNSYGILVQAAKTLANKLLRNRATLAGNICNSSPGGDMLPACLVLNGSVEIVSTDGIRQVKLCKFFTGVKRNVLKPDDLVTGVLFPKVMGSGIYLKKSRIRGHDLAQVSVAVYRDEDDNLYITIGAAGTTPILIKEFRKYKKFELIQSSDEIVRRVIDRISPISDVRATKSYRLAMVEYMTRQALTELGEV